MVHMVHMSAHSRRFMSLKRQDEQPPGQGNTGSLGNTICFEKPFFLAYDASHKAFHWCQWDGVPWAVQHEFSAVSKAEIQHHHHEWWPTQNHWKAFLAALLDVSTIEQSAVQTYEDNFQWTYYELFFPPFHFTLPSMGWWWCWWRHFRPWNISYILWEVVQMRRLFLMGNWVSGSFRSPTSQRSHSIILV